MLFFEIVFECNFCYFVVIYFYIYMMEVLVDFNKVEFYVEIFEKLMFGLGYLVYMLLYIYYWIGCFKDLICVNIDVVEVDEYFFVLIEVSFFYEFGYYMYNIYFVLILV